VVEQPLLAAAAPGRFEVVPLALVGGAEVQHLPVGCPGKAHDVGKGDHVLAEQRRCGRCRWPLLAALAEQDPPTRSDHPGKRVQRLLDAGPGV